METDQRHKIRVQGKITHSVSYVPVYKYGRRLVGWTDSCRLSIGPDDTLAWGLHLFLPIPVLLGKSADSCRLEKAESQFSV